MENGKMSLIEHQAVMKMCEDMHRSQWLPSHFKSPAQVYVAVKYGEEMGIPPITAIESFFYVKGKIGWSAHLMVAKVRMSGLCAAFSVKGMDDEHCSIFGKRSDTGEEQVVNYTIQQAVKAGYTKAWDAEARQWKEKDNWKNNPQDMLYARAASRLVRRLWPEVMMGAVYAKEELEDIAEKERLKEIKAEKEELEEIAELEAAEQLSLPKRGRTKTPKVHSEAAPVIVEEVIEEPEPPIPEVEATVTAKPETTPEPEQPKKPTMAQVSKFFAMLEKSSVTYDDVKKKFGITSINAVDRSKLDEIYRFLESNMTGEGKNE